MSTRGRIRERNYPGSGITTPSGIEPATFRFVTQHINHCTTAVPQSRWRQRKTPQKCLRKDNIGVLTNWQKSLTCCRAFLWWHHSSRPSPGTSVMLLTLQKLHPRPPVSCHTQRSHLEGDLSRATTHVHLQLHTSALSFFLITFTLFRWYSLFWEIIFMGKGLRSWKATCNNRSIKQ